MHETTRFWALDLNPIFRQIKKEFIKSVNLKTRLWCKQAEKVIIMQSRYRMSSIAKAVTVYESRDSSIVVFRFIEERRERGILCHHFFLLFPLWFGIGSGWFCWPDVLSLGGWLACLGADSTRLKDQISILLEIF